MKKQIFISLSIILQISCGLDTNINNGIKSINKVKPTATPTTIVPSYTSSPTPQTTVAPTSTFRLRLRLLSLEIPLLQLQLQLQLLPLLQHLLLLRLLPIHLLLHQLIPPLLHQLIQIHRRPLIRALHIYYYPKSKSNA